MAESGAPARRGARPQRAALGSPPGPREPWAPRPGPREPPEESQPRSGVRERARESGRGCAGDAPFSVPRHLVLLFGSAVTPAAAGPRRRSALRDGAAPASPPLHGRRCPGRRSERGAFPGGPGAGAAGAHRPAGGTRRAGEGLRAAPPARSAADRGRGAARQGCPRTAPLRWQRARLSQRTGR